MGTSSARRAPATRLWRLAKAAATRYLSPESVGTVEVRELAARYIAALEDGGAPSQTYALAYFRLTRRVAQNLGAFFCQENFLGWPAALEAQGLEELPENGPEVSAHSLSAALEAPGGGLEQAVAHAALAGVLLDLNPSPGPRPEAAPLVRRFLAQALRLRLVLDLGESLEAAAPRISHLQQGLAEIAGWIDQAAPLPPAAPQTPEEWQGLVGWTWVTSLLTGLMTHLTDPGSA